MGLVALLSFHACREEKKKGDEETPESTQPQNNGGDGPPQSGTCGGLKGAKLELSGTTATLKYSKPLAYIGLMVGDVYRAPDVVPSASCSTCTWKWDNVKPAGKRLAAIGVTDVDEDFCDSDDDERSAYVELIAETTACTNKLPAEFPAPGWECKHSNACASSHNGSMRTEGKDLVFEADHRYVFLRVAVETGDSTVYIEPDKTDCDGNHCVWYIHDWFSRIESVQAERLVALGLPDLYMGYCASSDDNRWEKMDIIAERGECTGEKPEDRNPPDCS